MNETISPASSPSANGRPAPSAEGSSATSPHCAHRIPGATYRLQFNREFTFRDARKIVPYLHELGVTDLYASPYFRARAESTHGYDIADHNQLNPGIGSESELAALVRALHSHDMGHVLDIVPNHMGIGEPANVWWMDVLENGPASLYADFFDIDWEPVKPELRGKVLLPVLGDQYGVVLENGELKLLYESGSFHICYYEHRFPIAPRTATRILSRAIPHLVATLGADHDATLELYSIVTGLGYLPSPMQTQPERRRERAREKEILKRRLAALVEAEPAAREAIDAAVAELNGTAGDPRSFDDLNELLDAQPYRLSFWRVAGEQINYRRFFDINDLAAIKMENPAVFEASHRLLLRLVGEGWINGLRIDHPDGLRDPAGYVARLQAAVRATGVGSPTDPLATWVVVEKILSGAERLPEDWLVDGTTGYEFAHIAGGLFVDRANRRAFDQIYDDFTRSRIDFRDLVYRQKKFVLGGPLAGELNTLARALDRITEHSRRYRDFTLNSLREALREVIACFPVYRSYITGPGELSAHDRNAIDTAIARARRLNPAVERSVFDFIQTVLLMQPVGDENGERAQLDFVQRFQQVTGPVMAKGFEDTAFYIYNRLVSLNEVGGEPDEFGVSPAHFHRANGERAARWPHTLLATSTHDTKRSEDVRARISVLSEVPEQWSAALEQWSTLNRTRRVILEDRVAPDRNEEYLLYQILLGAWPLERMDAAAYAAFRDRIAAYMLKAVKEAKVNTSWINPNAEYDEAVQRFVHSVLGEQPEAGPFVEALAPLRELTARFGAYNSLAQVLLKLTAPGVPDIYQGNELWDLSLVDPDNRRPVDYTQRARLLRTLLRRVAAAETPDVRARICRELLDGWRDGRIKLYLTRCALAFRRDHAELFRHGAYTPLHPAGAQANHLIAYQRAQADQRAVVVVPRLLTRITPDGAHPTGEAVWSDTLIPLPDEAQGTRYHNVLTGAEHQAVETAQGVALPVADLLRDLPFALLQGTGSHSNQESNAAPGATQGDATHE